MLSKKNLALVYAVDQMLDYFTLSNKPLPPTLSVTRETYDALKAYVGEEKSIDLMQLTHYRTVPVEIVNANNKT